MISVTNKFRIEAPVRTYTGESVGVAFSKGTGFVDDSTKEGRAAIEYFRRQAYGVFPADEATEDNDGAQTPSDPQEVDTPGSQFDPAEHDVPEVLAHLDSLVNGDTHDTAEFDRVIAAERDGKARKTILARGEQQQQEAGQ